MTMKERLKIHREIEAENEQKLKKWIAHRQVMKSYRLSVREGKFEVAWLLLKFLRNGSIRLGLWDEANEVEQLLEKIGYKPQYGRNYNTANFNLDRLRKGGKAA